MSKRDSDWTTFKAIRFGGGSPTEAGVQTITAAGHITLGYNLGSGVTLLERNIIYMDPGGSARNLILPAEADSMGAWLIVVNTADASEVITVQNDTPGTVCAIGQSEQAVVVCDGTTWRGATAPSTSESTFINDLTASAAEINAVADASARHVSIPDGAAYTLLAADSGKVHLLADQAQNCTITMPAEAAGLDYRFIYAGAAADTDDYIWDTGADANFFLGGVGFQDSAGTTLNYIPPDGDSNSKFSTVNTALGTHIRMFCDGTHWIIEGMVAADSAPTFADQA